MFRDKNSSKNNVLYICIALIIAVKALGTTAEPVQVFSPPKAKKPPPPPKKGVPPLPESLLKRQTIKWATHVYNNYYNKPYKYQNGGDSEPRYDPVTNTWVQRKNHGIAHAMRQGFEVRDVIDALRTIPAERLDTKGQNLQKYVKEKLKTDNRFKEKLEFVMLYTRAGREGEMSPSSNLAAYNQSGYNSAEYFKKDATIIAPNLFSTQEIETIYKSMLSEYVKTDLRKDETSEIYYLYQLSHQAHFIDLQRLGFLKWANEEFFKQSVVDIIGIKDASDNCIHQIITKGASYIHFTGEYTELFNPRDDNGNPLRYHTEFFKLDKDITKMANKLFTIYNYITIDCNSKRNIAEIVIELNKNNE